METENQTTQAEGVGNDGLLALMQWARSGESTGGERTQEVLKSLCDEIEKLHDGIRYLEQDKNLYSKHFAEKRLFRLLPANAQIEATHEPPKDSD